MLFPHLLWQKLPPTSQTCLKINFSRKSGQSGEIFGKNSEGQKNIFLKNVDIVPSNHHMAYGSLSISQNGVLGVFVHDQKK